MNASGVSHHEDAQGAPAPRPRPPAMTVAMTLWGLSAPLCCIFGLMQLVAVDGPVRYFGALGVVVGIAIVLLAILVFRRVWRASMPAMALCASWVALCMIGVIVRLIHPLELAAAIIALTGAIAAGRPSAQRWLETR